MPPILEWPELLPGLEVLPAKYQGPEFADPPTLCVLHRPATSLAVAEYFHASPDGRKVSTHLAPRRDGTMVQCVPFHRIAWGQGGGAWKGNKRLNFCSVSVELPHPMNQLWPKGECWQTACSNALLRLVAAALPSIVEVIGHHDCDPERRQDPGTEFPWAAVLDGVGWDCPHLG